VPECVFDCDWLCGCDRVTSLSKSGLSG